MTTKVTTCHECACGIANDDWTHIDYHHCGEDADRAMALVSANLERFGWLTHVGEADEPGYFACDICWETQCGGGELFETDKAVD